MVNNPVTRPIVLTIRHVKHGLRRPVVTVSALHYKQHCAWSDGSDDGGGCSWSVDPRVRHTVWGLAVGLGFSWAAGVATSQAAVQRYSATKSIHHARL